MAVERFRAAVEAFDRENARDPRQEQSPEGPRPRELLQAERLSAWVERLAPEASEALRLAARCQHLRRFEVPRSAYPEGRTGYLRWRKDLAKFHADRAAEILASVGYDPETIARVQRINLKRNLKLDAETQTMEDALCLSFMEHELEEFARKHPPDKVVAILRKTWQKMSPRGQQEALRLSFSEELRSLIHRALSPGQPR